MKYKIIKKIFGPLLNKPCWNIRRGQYRSAIFFEFGKPNLKIYERKKEFPGQKPLLTSRTITLRGEWSLLIDFCSWIAYSKGEKVGNWKSKHYPDRVADSFNGQALKDVIIKPETGESVFVFDLGGRFETYPCDDSSQWDLFTPSGKILSYRADGKYAFAFGNKPTPETAWKEFRV